jgi:cell division protein FtsL
MFMRLLNIGVIATLVLAAAYVYDIKYQSTLRAERVAKMRHDIQRERDAVASLRAEWARLGNPRRIQTLAQRYLELKPFQTSQVDNFDSLPMRPPQIVQPQSEDPIGAMLEDDSDLTAATGSIAPTPSAGKTDRQR